MGISNVRNVRICWSYLIPKIFVNSLLILCYQQSIIKNLFKFSHDFTSLCNMVNVTSPEILSNNYKYENEQKFSSKTSQEFKEISKSGILRKQAGLVLGSIKPQVRKTFSQFGAKIALRKSICNVVHYCDICHTLLAPYLFFFFFFFFFILIL